MKEEENKIRELKKLIAVNKVTQGNIERYNALRNRELVIMPHDSKYFKDFQEWTKRIPGRYNSESELAPIYISGKNADRVLDTLIEAKEIFVKPHKEKLAKILANVPLKRSTNAHQLQRVSPKVETDQQADPVPEGTEQM
jgi:hypothetical protein